MFLLKTLGVMFKRKDFTGHLLASAAEFGQLRMTCSGNGSSLKEMNIHYLNVYAKKNRISISN